MRRSRAGVKSVRRRPWPAKTIVPGRRLGALLPRRAGLISLGLIAVHHSGASTMFVLEARSERIAVLALTVLMAATRIEHFDAGQIAPDASTAVFFLAGLLIGNPLWLLALLAEALLLDLTAIKVVGVEAV